MQTSSSSTKTSNGQSQHLQMTNTVSQVTRIYRPSINQASVPLVSITPNVVRSNLVQARVTENPSPSESINQQSPLQRKPSISNQRMISVITSNQSQQPQQEPATNHDKLIKAVRKIAEKQNIFVQKVNQITEKLNQLVERQVNFEKEVREKLDEFSTKFSGIFHSGNKEQEDDLDELLEAIDLQESVSLISLSQSKNPGVTIKSEINGDYGQQPLIKKLRNVRSKYAKNMNYNRRRSTTRTPRFQCPHCEKNYSRNDGLRRHIRRDHEEEDDDFY